MGHRVGRQESGIVGAERTVNDTGNRDIWALTTMNLESKTVSVVIPTYNRGAFIGAAIDSVLSQSYRNLEVIVVDDGSTDNTAALLAAIADPRLRYVRQENQGRSQARNAALRLAVGDYIAFLDSDDLYLPGKLTLQVGYLEAHPDVAMVYTASICVDEAGDPLGLVYEATISGDIYAEIALFLPVTITLPTVMLRREVLDVVGTFDERMERFEDTDMWRRIAKRYRVGALAAPTCKVRTHADNTLVNQNPTKILAALEYYIDKVNREDSDVDPLIRGAGARRLCEYYATAMLGLQSQALFGRRLLKQAREYFHPKVSIIIPVYNGANYLADAIESAFEQTYDNIEVIVVNDGSTDDGATERVAQRFGECIRYISKPNGGVATALNRGIAEMTGDYFSWLSHDDLYEPSKIAVQVDALVGMSDPRQCVLYSDWVAFTDDPQSTWPGAAVFPHVEPKDFRRFITTQNILHGCTLLIPQRAFEEHGGFNPELRTTQDYDLWFRMASTLRFVHQPVTLVKARSHPEQGSLHLAELALQECDELLKGFVGKLSEAEVRQDASVSLAEGYFRLAHNLVGRGFLAAGVHATELGCRHLTQWDADVCQRFFNHFFDERAAGEAAVQALSREVAELSQQRDALQARNLDYSRELDEVKCARSTLLCDVAVLTQQRDLLDVQFRECRQDLQDSRQVLDEVHRSHSWRVTEPLRRVSQLVSRVVGRGRTGTVRDSDN